MEEKDSECNGTFEFLKLKWIYKAIVRLYILIHPENAEQSKNSTVLETLNQQKLFGSNQFPKMIAEPDAILINHSFKFNKLKTSHYNMGKNNSEINDETKMRQHNQYINEPNLSFAHFKMRCYCCGKNGHKSPQCKYTTLFQKKSGL